MEEVLEILKSIQERMDENQAKADDNTRTMQEKINASQKEAKAMRNDMKAHQAKAETDKEDILAKMDASMKYNQEQMLAKMTAWEAEDKARREKEAETGAIRIRTKAMRDKRMKASRDACFADIKNNRKETTACQNAMEANLEKVEPNPGEKEAAVERQETSNEEVAIHPLTACRNEGTVCQEKMEAHLKEEEELIWSLRWHKKSHWKTPVGEPRNRRRDRRNLAAERRQKKQHEWTQSKDGCRKNLVAACSGGTTQENSFYKGHEPEVPEGIGRNLRREDPPCRNGTVQET
jgi:hypothetical protein